MNEIRKGCWVLSFEQNGQFSIKHTFAGENPHPIIIQGFDCEDKARELIDLLEAYLTITKPIKPQL